MNIGWICGFVLGMLGIIGHFVYPTLNPYSSSFLITIARYNYWLLVIGFLIVSLSSNRRY